MTSSREVFEGGKSVFFFGGFSDNFLSCGDDSIGSKNGFMRVSFSDGQSFF